MSRNLCPSEFDTVVCDQEESLHAEIIIHHFIFDQSGAALAWIDVSPVRTRSHANGLKERFEPTLLHRSLKGAMFDHRLPLGALVSTSTQSKVAPHDSNPPLLLYAKPGTPTMRKVSSDDGITRRYR